MLGEQIAGSELHFQKNLFLSFFRISQGYVKIDLPLLMQLLFRKWEV